MALLSNNDISGRTNSILMGGRNIDELLEKEWLLSNSRGGFSSGTVIGCNTRRYHGLLIGSLNPPAKRAVGLSACLETVEIGNEAKQLANFEFDGTIAPNDFEHLNGFHKDIGVHFDYDLWHVKITKSVYLLPGDDTVAIVYTFFDMIAEFTFSIRPFVALRDFHSLLKSDTLMYSTWRNHGISVQSNSGGSGEIHLASEDMRFEEDNQWWYNFLYRKERERGSEHFEDLWSPGIFKRHIDSPGKIILWASYGECDREIKGECDDLEIVLNSLMLRERDLAKANHKHDKVLQELYSAAGQFVIERQIDEKPSPTILAGFPWFLDWGRDVFISLEGLLLCTDRFEEAAGVLTTFAGAIDEGMIPNRFDDYGGQAHYNSIDASLWFVQASFEYLRITGDKKVFGIKLLPAIRWIMDAYRMGSKFGIHADVDGLISGGDENTQLTWMDAKCGDLAFTPRYGKAVEINALWYSGLCQLSDFYNSKDKHHDQLGVEPDKDAELREFYGQLAEKAQKSFCEKFWNEQVGYLNDCIFPDGTADSSLRPNQIYAVSLPNSPLSDGQKKYVVAVIERDLLTPYGLRTLSPKDPRYKGRYEGNSFERDSAYHQGTVWPYLIGTFIEAFLKVNDFSTQSRQQAYQYLEPLLTHLTQDGCIGSISEIFDGDQPQRPRGCFAQAWSVAEVLRAYKLIKS